MAIDLRKNPSSYSPVEKPYASMQDRQYRANQWNRKRKILKFMTIFMIVITTAVMILGFGFLPVSRNSFILITFLNLLGYLTAFCYYDAYRKMEGGENE